MARYPKRQKVKRYRRSFYTREMRLKKGIGIAVLVVAVLAAAWVAAPHVLDWATHTWYTVVRDRDLSASSAVSESASSGTQSTAASEPAASSVPEKEPEPEVKGTDIVTGLWAEVDVTTLTDEAAIRSAARQLKAQGMTYAILTLKDTAAGVLRLPDGGGCRQCSPHAGRADECGIHLQGGGAGAGGRAECLP